MKERTILSALALLAVLGVVAVGAAGAVDNPEMPYTQNLTADDSTEEIRVLAENVENDTAQVTWYEVENHTDTGPNGSRSKTEVANATLNTSTSSTDSVTYAGIDIGEGNTTVYEVEVAGDGAASLTLEEIVAVSGGGAVGGSGLLGSLDTTTLGGIAVVLAVLYLAMGRDD